MTVDYGTSDGTATAPSDYAPTRGTVTFAPGESTKTIAVAVAGDTAVEPDETLAVTLSNPVNATIADASATGRITNDEIAPKAGHYTGRLTEGSGSVDFDLDPYLSIGNLKVVLTVHCGDGRWSTRPSQETFDFSGSWFPVNPEWFTINIPPQIVTIERGGTLIAGQQTFTFSGSLGLTGTASGTPKVVKIFNIIYNPSILCHGDGQWSATYKAP